MDSFLIAIFLFGHVALGVAVFNRLHAVSVMSRVIRVLELLVVLAVAGSALWIVAQTWSQPDWLSESLQRSAYRSALASYVVSCCLFAVWVSGRWFRRRGWSVPSQGLLTNHTERVDVAAQRTERLVRGWSTRLLDWFPGNQMLSLCIHEKEVVLPRLPPELDGLAVVHLSDLHLSGKIAQPYFDYVIDRANELNADFAAITGDILEHERCWDWLPLTIGRLRSRHGTCFILGNHDKRVRDVERLRACLNSLGMHDVGRSTWLTEVRGQRILLAGNELPWFGPPPEFSRADDPSHALRILLTHSPDQINWARERDFDLALAGHTHGGHIRLPLVGPVVCPSRFGVTYASGTFYEHPTLLHVSRGISGLDPIRLNCPPELTKLVLRCRRD